MSHGHTRGNVAFKKLAAACLRAAQKSGSWEKVYQPPVSGPALGGVEKAERGSWTPGLGAPDCFFQLGYLNFAEADYQEALTLSPRDEGANLRMGLLQEKMGFCEHRSKCAGAGGGAGPGRGGGGGGAKSWGRGPGLEAACWDPWVKKLSQLCPLNIGFNFHVFAKKKKTFTVFLILW